MPPPVSFPDEVVRGEARSGLTPAMPPGSGWAAAQRRAKIK